MLNYEELDEIIEEVTSRITLANRTGSLEILLKQWGLEKFLPSSSIYETDKNGKIVVIGASEVKENILNGIIKSCGLNQERFEFCLDYTKAKTYTYKKLQYNPNYRIVIFGAVMKSHEGYPRVEVLSSNSEVKITKSNFKELLNRLIDEDFI